MGPLPRRSVSAESEDTELQILYFLDSGVITSLSLPLFFSCDFYYIPDTHVRCSPVCAIVPHAVTTGMTQTSRGKKYWGISLLCSVLISIYTDTYDMPH